MNLPVLGDFFIEKYDFFIYKSMGISDFGNSQNFKISNFQKSEKQFSKSIFRFFKSFPNILSYARFQSASRQPDTVPHLVEFGF